MNKQELAEQILKKYLGDDAVQELKSLVNSTRRNYYNLILAAIVEAIDAPAKEGMIEDVLLEIAVEVEKQVCREIDRLSLDDQQSDVFTENISMVFDNNKRKWIKKLMQCGESAHAKEAISVPAQQGVGELAQIDITNFIKAAFQILVGRGEDAMYQYMKDKKVEIRPAAQPLQPSLEESSPNQEDSQTREDHI
jgi:hypothetical protein